ncbi:MAG: PepSY domain-containing protein [Rhodospirillaceae bacterium]|nr:PepSY domain-containing protein [Rhodospirillaceae bacterium]
MTPARLRLIKRIALAAVIFGVPAVVLSAPPTRPAWYKDDDDDDALDHVKAFEALRSGKIVPITKILDYLEKNFRGNVVEIELESEKGIMVYEVEYLTEEGDFLEFDFDATTGALMTTKGSGIDKARKKP